ncbi:hypothetical protein PFFCH_01054 [Plasmodium falciparum FCH/4]|uniref:Uncharacterized protein n=3 Tax=Plasmodium falciparum TaxID=5833 RepID=A0A024VT35_PLAFA|nr:hypothetical protein PFFCH_01054 [Plasmodium falciparum FCH/4]
MMNKFFYNTLNSSLFQNFKLKSSYLSSGYFFSNRSITTNVNKSFISNYLFKENNFFRSYHTSPFICRSVSNSNCNTLLQVNIFSYQNISDEKKFLYMDTLKK